MSLESQLKDFGVSDLFVKICMKYKEHYEEGSDIEAFIEYVEEEHAKVEEAQFEEHEKKLAAQAQEMMGFGEDEDDAELDEAY